MSIVLSKGILQARANIPPVKARMGPRKMSGEKSFKFCGIPNLTSLGSDIRANSEATVMIKPQIKPQKTAFSVFLWSRPPKKMMIAPVDVICEKNASLVVRAPENIVRAPPTIERTVAAPNLSMMRPFETFRITDTSRLFGQWGY